MNEDETKKSGRSEENPKQNKCNRFSLLRARWTLIYASLFMSLERPLCRENSHLQRGTCMHKILWLRPERARIRATYWYIVCDVAVHSNFEQYIKWSDKDDDSDGDSGGGGGGGGQRIYSIYIKNDKRKTEIVAHIPLWKRPTQMANRF